MDMEDRENRRELSPADLRGILKYVPQWRNHVFVVAVDGAVMEEDTFGNLLLELAVLRNLSIRLVLVHGIGHQLQNLAQERGQTLSDLRGYGPTDAATLNLAIEASGKVGAMLERGLTQVSLRYAFGSFLRATERGLIKGVDQLYSGKVERIDTDLLTRLLDQEVVPVIDPIAFNREGQALRINSDLLASELALALKASKLIFVLPYPGLSYKGSFRLNADVREVKAILEKEPETIDEPVRSKASYAVRTIEGGTPRAHIIDSRIHDGLLLEIFSKVGVGSMIHSNPYTQIRPARKRDVPALFNLTKLGVKDESLRRRSRQSLERDIGEYFVYEIDESVIGCVRLSPYPGEDVAELGSVFVHPAYQGRHIGKTLVDYAVEEARQRRLKRLVALTTQAYPFFRNHAGFNDGSYADLPPALREEAEKSGRNSRALVRDL